MKTLYQQVSQHILEQIQTGAIKIGDKLPAEGEYAAALGISRSTLRLALTELENGGFLNRRKRSGTMVISDEPKKRFTMDTEGLDGLMSLGRNTEFVIHDILTVQREYLPQMLAELDNGEPWLCVCGTRSLSEQKTAFSVNRVYVPSRYKTIQTQLQHSHNAVYRVIEDTFDLTVARVSQNTKAIACPAADAKFMGLPTAAPVLQITAQLYDQNEELMEISFATFDPDQFEVQTDVKIA